MFLARRRLFAKIKVHPSSLSILGAVEDIGKTRLLLPRPTNSLDSDLRNCRRGGLRYV